MKFINLCEQENFETPLNDMLINNNELIEAFLGNDQKRLEEKLHRYSYLQYVWLEKMIPQKFKKAWFDALDTKKLFFKLCGAGGGGFLLAYTKDESLLEGMEYYSLLSDPSGNLKS